VHKKLFYDIQRGMVKNRRDLEKLKPASASPVQELLDNTSHYNEELERFKLKMMIRDIKHRKTLMLLRVPGLQNIAPHFKYFQEAVESRRRKS
jgi:hypothetical protein